MPQSKSKSKRPCLVCGDVERQQTRGLCSQHYQQFKTKRDSLTLDAAKAWESELIAAGKLLPSRQGKRTDAGDDAFADLFLKFAQQHPGALKSTADLHEDAEAMEARRETAKRSAGQIAAEAAATYQEEEGKQAGKTPSRRKKSG